MEESSQKASVVVVDDEPCVREYLTQVLDRSGYECHSFSGGLAALSYLSGTESPPDLVLTDIDMPGMRGTDLLRNVKVVAPDLPVILISGLYELGLAIDALKMGAADYLLKPATPDDVTKLVAKHLQTLTRSRHFMAQEALRRFTSSRNRNRPLDEQVQEVFEALSFKRYETMQHSKRVAAHATLLGAACGLGRDELNHLELGALLHDIGKITTPHNVLLKTGPLDEDQWVAMRLHPTIGAELLGEFPELEQEAEIVHRHHERYDGNGYPDGHRSEQIPIGARIFSIVDTLDAITSDRPYRAGQPIAIARQEIRKHRATQFDPRLVDIFLRIPESELEAIRKAYPDNQPG